MISLKQLKTINQEITEFFEKVDRRGRIAGRVRRLMDRNEKYLRPKVNEWLEAMRAKIVSDLSRKFAKQQALDITTELTDWKWIQDNGHSTLKPALLKVLGNGAQEAFTIAGIEGSFDILNPRSVAWAEKHCAKLVREVTDETRKGIKAIVARGIKEGKAMPKIAKEIRPLVGLTERQMISVANREEWLIINRPELSQIEIDRRVDVYARRMHRGRAETISRTESANAVDEGTLEGYEEAEVEEVEWCASAGACEICEDLNGQRFKMSEAHGRMTAHPRCRCAWVPVVPHREVPKPRAKPMTTPSKPSAEKPGGELTGKQWVDSLNYDEKKILGYWQGSGYENIRAIESTGKGSSSIKGALKNFYKALDRAKPHQGDVWRGLNNLSKSDFDKIVKAKTFQWKATSSAAMQEKGAVRFLGSKGNNVMFRIHNKSGVDITSFVGKEESEVLLRKATKYKVIGRAEKTYAFKGKPRKALEILLEEL